MTNQQRTVLNAAKALTCSGSGSATAQLATVSLRLLMHLTTAVDALAVAEAREKIRGREFVVMGHLPYAVRRKQAPPFPVLWNIGAKTAKQALAMYALEIVEAVVSR